MKYIKMFENLKPEVGDYVICKEDGDTYSSIEFNNYLSNSVGRIIKNSSDSLFHVTFDHLPSDDVLKYSFYVAKSSIIRNLDKSKYKMFNDKYTNVTILDKTDIIDWSKNKEELELKLAANKYNI